MLAKASLAVALGVLQVANGALVPQFSAFKDSLRQISDLVPRQFEGTVCDSQCSVFENAVNTCTTASCICSSSAEAGLQSCVTCAVDAAPTADVISSAQQLIDTYEGTCPGATIVIPGSGGITPTTAKGPTSVAPIQTTTQPVIPPPVTTVISPPTQLTQTVISTNSLNTSPTPTPQTTQTPGNSIAGGGNSGALSTHASASVGLLGIIVALVMFAL